MQSNKRNVLNATYALILSFLFILATPPSAIADINTNSYDGNIFALYAGNGALVPPSTSLEEAVKLKKPILLAFYLDDNNSSKRFAPLLSDLQGRWGKDVELIALPSDPYKVDPSAPNNSPNHYWNGMVPQIVVIDASTNVLFSGQGNMNEAEIEQALAKATGRSAGNEPRSKRSFNEYNSEFSS